MQLDFSDAFDVSHYRLLIKLGQLFGTFLLYNAPFLSFGFHTNLLLWFWCLCLPLISPLSFPCAMYSVCDTHPVHEIPVP